VRGTPSPVLWPARSPACKAKVQDFENACPSRPIPKVAPREPKTRRVSKLYERNDWRVVRRRGFFAGSRAWGSVMMASANPVAAAASMALLPSRERMSTGIGGPHRRPGDGRSLPYRDGWVVLRPRRQGVPPIAGRPHRLGMRAPSRTAAAAKDGCGDFSEDLVAFSNGGLPRGLAAWRGNPGMYHAEGADFVPVR
jgi:hypothetical protein